MANDTNGDKWTMRPVVASLLVVGTFALFWFIQQGQVGKEVITLIVGALIANLTSVVSFYFGSSAGSAKKDDTVMLALQKTGQPTCPPESKEQ